MSVHITKEAVMIEDSLNWKRCHILTMTVLNEYACYKGSSVIENCHILTMTVLNEYACYKGSSSDWRQSGLRMIAPNRCAVKMWNEYSAKKEEEKKDGYEQSHWMIGWMNALQRKWW